MESLITPDFIKMVIALATLGGFLVRYLEKLEHARREEKRLEREEGRQFRQQMMAGLKSIESRQEKLESWASNHERADRLRFRRMGRCMESVLPPEQRHMAGRVM